jgi:hypothetical protein
MMRRLKSIASGRSSVSDPVRARPPRPPHTAIRGPGTRIGCLMKLCECSVHRLRFGGILLIVRCSGSRSSFRSFAWLLAVPRRWQIGKALFCLLWSIWHSAT